VSKVIELLGRLTGRRPPLSPEEYERVRCDVCQGKGMTQKLGAFGTSGSFHACWKCHGKGWLTVKRER
jgi:DnaJ-class molecular chaperone